MLRNHVQLLVMNVVCPSSSNSQPMAQELHFFATRPGFDLEIYHFDPQNFLH